MAVGGLAAINLISLANTSYIGTRACTFLWPFVIVISAIRAIIMIVELQNGKEKIEWECANGGQLWTTSATAGYATGNIPPAFCTTGFSSLYTVFVVCLLADIACQVYMFFLSWRYPKRLEHYSSLRLPEP